MIWIDAVSWLSAVLLASSLLILAWNAVAAPRLRRADAPRRAPKVSVLVPCRNEEANLPRVLESWSRVQYPDWELVVLDDRSEDASRAILEDWKARIPRLRVVDGSPPPAGWLGKNWACHNLSLEARGDLLLFADADVAPAPEAVASTVAALERENADAVSGFGRQTTRHWATEALVPLVMELPLAGFLPMRLAVQRPEPALSAAVGQWFLFRRETYGACGGHASVRATVVEDVALGGAIKRSGGRLVPAFADEVLDVEMYRDFRETWNGFAKNLSQAAGGGVTGFVIVQLPAALCFLVPWVLAPSGRFPSLLAFALLVALRIGASVLWKRPLRGVLWHPVGSLLLLAIGIRSALVPFRPVLWKGRVPCARTAPQS
jgi:chlorobactene glucosyltransferase